MKGWVAEVQKITIMVIAMLIIIAIIIDCVHKRIDFNLAGIYVLG